MASEMTVAAGRRVRSVMTDGDPHEGTVVSADDSDPRTWWVRWDDQPVSPVRARDDEFVLLVEASEGSDLARGAEMVADALKEEPTLRERMRVRSQMPELDDVFVPEIDFPGTVVRPGEYAERTFALSRECRLVGVRKPRGLVLERLVLKVGVDFRAVPKRGDGTDPPYTEYEGKDCLVFDGPRIAEGGWKTHRLAPELSAGVYLLVWNETADDLRFEGTLRLEEDRVPEPDHEEV